MPEFPYNDNYHDQTGTRDSYGSILGIGTFTRIILDSAVIAGLVAVPLPASNLSGRKTLTVQNQGTAPVYIGGPTVTVASGYQLLPKAGFVFNINDKVTVYAISGSANQDLRIIEGA